MTTKSIYAKLPKIIILIMVLFAFASPVFAQTPQLVLDVNIVDPTGGTVETGQIIEYVIDFSCASTTIACGQLDISFPLDIELEFVEVISPPGYLGSHSGGVVTIVNNTANNPDFEDGEAAQVTVRARVGQTLDDNSIDTEVTGTITNGGVTSTVTSDTPALTINTPEGGWGVDKNQTAPGGSAGPIEGGDASYSIEVCPADDTLGVAQLDQIIINDRFPEGADASGVILGSTISANATIDTVVVSNQNTVDDPGTPLIDESITDDTITWTITPNASPHTLDNGCITVGYTLTYPAVIFTSGTDITNEAYVSATVLNSNDFPDDGGECPMCIGRANNPNTIDDPTADIAANKSGPGTTVVSPGLSNGTSTFGINWNLSDANVDTADLVIEDTFPVAISDGLPIIEVDEITAPTWSGGFQAVLEYEQVSAPGTYVPLATLDGSTATVFNSGNSSIPAVPHALADLITRVRVRFLDDVPPGFSTDSDMIIRFFVRDGMDSTLGGDYDNGVDSYRDYDNCIDFTGSFTNAGGATEAIPPDQTCTNVRISDDDVDGITNIQTSKSRDVPAVFPLENIQFTLTLDLTQEASGNLINPAIQDILPAGMQVISWDEVNFSTAMINDGETTLPYLRLDDVDVAGVRRQRLLFYWGAVKGNDADTLLTVPADGYAPTYTPRSYTCTGTPCQTVSSPVFPSYDYSPQAGTAPAVDNDFTITPPATGVKTITILFTAQPRLDAVANTNVPNTTTVVTDSANISCQSGTESSEGADDIDDDGITGEVTCQTNTEFEIREAAQMSSQKWIRDLALTPQPTPLFVNSQNLNQTNPSCPTYTYAGNDYTRYPCVAQGAAGGDFEYLMRIQNTGLVDTDEYILYDVLPHTINGGDTGVSEALSDEDRDTEFRVYMTGPIAEEYVPAGFNYIVEYNVDPDYDSCRPEMSASATETPVDHWQSGCDDTWVTTVADWSTVTSFRIVQIDDGGVIPRGDELIFTVPMLIDGTPGEAETGEISWNSFAQRFTNEPSGRRLLTAEPRKVGIIVEEVFSVGNRVWIDDGIGGGIANNGLIDGGEAGINGVTVELYYDDGSGSVLYATDVTRQNANTGGDGYYFFGNLPSGTYRVLIPPTQFQTAGTLQGYVNSSGSRSATLNDNVDNRDTGLDPSSAASHAFGGVSSATFTLTRNNEAVGETDVNDDNTNPDVGGTPNPQTNEGSLGRGQNYEQDADSDLTVDFGFYRPMSIGNLVWRDNGRDLTAPNEFNATLFNNGLFDGDEQGIAGVTVELFGDFDHNGTEDTTPRTLITDADGYYLFDGLAAGDYRVEIPETNFAGGQLDGLNSSTDVALPVDGDPDSDDHGRDVAIPVTTPVVSDTIVLETSTEPTDPTPLDTTNGDDEDDEAGTGTGSNGELDINSDLTVDFGFVALMSIGNRIWIDDGADTSGVGGFTPTQFDDGVLNGTEAGVPNVVVNLYLDNNDGAGGGPDGIPDTATPIATDLTDGTGYYLFDNLPQGNYIVEIPTSEFDADGENDILGDADDGPLAGFISSTDIVAPLDGDADNDDHGIDVADPTTAPILSPTIPLFANTELTTDDSEDTTGTNDNTPPDILDANSDLTVDFGFIRPMSIGNRVWMDVDRITGQPGDGIRQAIEDGVGEVIVQLYTADSSGNLGIPIAQTTTTGIGLDPNNGYYLFDRFGADQTATGVQRLGPGNYIVHIPESQFDPGAPLFGTVNSDGVAGSGVDFGSGGLDSVDDGGDENGVNATATDSLTYPVNAGVSSTIIQLRYDTEATSTTETDRDPNRVTDVDGLGVEDDNSDMTVDFAFYRGLAIGNRVWFDGNRDGFIDGTDDHPDAIASNPGIEGVTVHLYQADAGGNPINLGTPFATTVTDADGYYLFDQTGDQSILNGGLLLEEGDYIVAIDRSAGNNATVLDTYISTITRADGSGTPLATGTDADVDNDDNGIDRRDTGSPTALPIIFSEVIELSDFTEVTTETDRQTDGTVGANGDGRYGIQDYNSNLTVDFGFFIPMSIGNRVWFDTNNNGEIDAGTEAGINGVIVELFRDNGSGINPATDTPYRTTLTETNSNTGELGYYIFDDLPPGDYIVRLSPDNFNPDDPGTTTVVEGILTGASGSPYSSSESGTTPQSDYLNDNQTDNNDNGVDEDFPQTNGIVSNVITLSYFQEPDGDTDPSGEDLNTAADDTDLDTDGSAGPTGEGTFGERDDNADMTVDFGLYPPEMSIGNRVFKDYNNNRIIDGADVGVEGVVVNLFFDNTDGAGGGPDGIPDFGISSPISTTTTDAQGYYLFDGLAAGNYLVQVDEINFRTSGNGTLRDFYSSQDKDTANNPVPPTDNENDEIENGVDNPFSLANNPDPQAQGVFSPTILLEPSGEITTEDPGTLGDGEPNIQPSNSDLTVDFGFYQPMSIGNVVWFDTSEDGLFNGSEVGIAGVQVELYLDDGDGIFNGTDSVVPVFNGSTYDDFDITDANGFYLFDNLVPGQYWVHIPSSNFTTGNALFSHSSTVPDNATSAVTPNTDSNDNGIVTPIDTEFNNGVTSELVQLGVDNGFGLLIPHDTNASSEPINETSKSNNPSSPADTYDGPTSIGRYGELDKNSDITIDFGFVLPNIGMSIGNRVWFDTNHNGLIDNAGDDNPVAPGNPGIENVVVLLYRANAAGNPIGNPVARDITNSEGYYLFDVLDSDAVTGTGEGLNDGGPITPGNYVVAIPNSNFTAGNPLETYVSTTTHAPNDGTLAPSTAIENTYFATPLENDNNDNGTRNATYGVISSVVTLVLDGERDDEDASNKDATDVDGTYLGNPITVENSDLTVDFGFYLPMSLGNFVWVDTNNDGIYDNATESPVDDGVLLGLYASDGVTPIDDPANPGTPYQVTTDGGFYLFEGLPPGDYIVVLEASNFGTDEILEGYLGSDANGTGFEDDTDADLNDNGRDVLDPTAAGIPSGIVTLEYGTEPETEATSGNAADGPNGRGNNGELDNNSNLTVDFGVYPSTYYSIGNRVWIDDGASPADGTHDTDEAGRENVLVYLYRDENDGTGGGPDGRPDTVVPIATTTTDADGYYLFDSLPQGNYIVSIPPDNFEAGGALRGFSASAIVDSTESPNDNLSDHTALTIDPDFGIFSATYALGDAPEVTGETDPTGATQDSGVDPAGTPIPDAQSDLTVDFGFFRSMSIGNLVWFDINQDGDFDDATESGIGSVTVELYTDDDGSGDLNAGDTLIDTDVTDGNGFYLFNNLDEGDYLIHIPYDPNWSGGGATPLLNFESTQPDAGADDVTDDNDNGIGDSDPDPVNGVTSQVLTLAFDLAPTGESTLSGNTDDGPEFRGANNPPDNNSDLTWDFGFYLGTPMSIGNLVWIDDGNTTGTASNGERDGDELGVDGVIVNLYRDDSDGFGGPPDGVPDTNTPLQTTTTANGGYYLFDGLPPGNYIVEIDEDNFDGGVLNGYLSTSPETPDDDDNDNGVDNPTPTNDGIRSGTIVLELNNEPTTDDSEDVTGTGDNGELDENSNLTVDFGFIAAYDWGDAPDSYGTDNDPATTDDPTNDDSDEVGPSHRIIANLYLGASVDDESNGQPVPTGTSNNTGDPDGDTTDEDGLDPPSFVAGTTVTVDITAFNETGQTATLIAWFDWNGNGVFEDSEAYSTTVPNNTDGVVQIEVDVPDDAQDLTGGNTYARLRYTIDTLTTSDPTGPVDSGEVEDYYVEVLDPGLLINKTDGLNSIVAGETNTYTIVIENSGAERLGVRFYDSFQLATDTDANGYNPETIEWVCVAEDGASCIANDPAGTGSSGGPFDEDAAVAEIDELIDLPRDSRVTYTVTAQVNESAGLIPAGNTTPLINIAQLPNEAPPLEDEDETAIIFDPPYGVKVGTLLDDDIIRWTMTWYNPGDAQTGVVIEDELNAGQSFPDTTAEIDLQCSGSVGVCEIVGDDTVRWTGTMLQSTPDDDDEAVIIEFNVIVAGNGRYTNDATLSLAGVEAEASDSVRVGGSGDDDDDDDVDPATDDGSGADFPSPSLTKTVDTPFTLPGATVVWTIQAINDTDQTVNNVSITDNVPSSLTVTDSTTSSGELSVNGQTVVVKQDTFAPGETITITITTDVGTNVEVPFAINNPAILRCDCPNDSNAIATIVSVLELPSTGEQPWWRNPFLLAVALTGALGLAYRRKRKQFS